jgi:hypothetical protein
MPDTQRPTVMNPLPQNAAWWRHPFPAARALGRPESASPCGYFVTAFALFTRVPCEAIMN